VETGKVLVVKRRNDFASEIWADITGRMDQHEEPQNALKREVKEETGLDIEIVKFLNLFHMYRGEKKAENELIGIVYWCKTKSNKVILSEEHSDYKWIRPEEALNLVEFESIKEDYRKFIKAKNNEKN
jgi:8-oxo-dGTP diphosphatase